MTVPDFCDGCFRMPGKFLKITGITLAEILDKNPFIKE